MKPSERPPHDKKPSAKDEPEQGELSVEDIDRVAGGVSAPVDQKGSIVSPRDPATG